MDEETPHARSDIDLATGHRTYQYAVLADLDVAGEQPKLLTRTAMPYWVFCDPSVDGGDHVDPALEVPVPSSVLTTAGLTAFDRTLLMFLCAAWRFPSFRRDRRGDVVFRPEEWAAAMGVTEDHLRRRMPRIVETTACAEAEPDFEDPAWDYWDGSPAVEFLAVADGLVRVKMSGSFRRDVGADWGSRFVLMPIGVLFDRAIAHMDRETYMAMRYVDFGTRRFHDPYRAGSMFFVSQQRLASVLGVSTRTVIRRIKSLVAAGLVRDLGRRNLNHAKTYAWTDLQQVYDGEIDLERRPTVTPR